MIRLQPAGIRAPPDRVGGSDVVPAECETGKWQTRILAEELESEFKFARQKSKLAGAIRGSYFVIKGEY